MWCGLFKKKKVFSDVCVNIWGFIWNFRYIVFDVVVYNFGFVINNVKKIFYE